MSLRISVDDIIPDYLGGSLSETEEEKTHPGSRRPCEDGNGDWRDEATS